MIAALHPSTPVSIAHVIFRLAPGGMENGLINLVNSLDSERYFHHIISLTDATEFSNRLRSNNVKIYELHKRPGRDLSAYCKLWVILRRIRPDIVHTRNWGTLDLCVVAWMAGIKIRIHGEHGWDAGDPTGQSRKYRLLRKLCDLLITDWVVVSDDLGKWLSGWVGIERSKIWRIYNGVDCSEFRPLTTNPPEGDIAKAPDLITFGTVGRLDPVKNHELLIEAFQMLVAANDDLGPKLRLVIVGDGPTMPGLRRAVQKTGLEGQIVLVGHSDNVCQHLNNFDVFVLPSLNEGISNTILEAMAVGLPVIASRVGGNTELIVEGECGLLFPSGDAKALLDAMQSLGRNVGLRESYGHGGMVRANSLFGLKTMISEYDRLYSIKSRDGNH